MENLTNEYFRKLAADLKFNLSDEECDHLRDSFKVLEEQVAFFDTLWILRA